MDQFEGIPISNDRVVTTAVRLPMTPERIAQILRLSVAALAEGLEQVLDVLKSSDERARIAEGERDGLSERISGFELRAARADATQLAAQPEGVPPIQRIIELLRSEIPDRQLSVNHGDEIQGYADGLEEAISILESFTDADLILPPDPVPEEATKPTRLGRIGTTVLDFESEIEYIKQLDAKPGEAPGQFTDRDRECFRAGLMHGCRKWIHAGI